MYSHESDVYTVRYYASASLAAAVPVIKLLITVVK